MLSIGLYVFNVWSLHPYVHMYIFIHNQHSTGWWHISIIIRQIYNTDRYTIFSTTTSTSTSSNNSNNLTFFFCFNSVQVIQPNQITQAQLQQGITWAPQFLQNLQNPIFIRGTQPDQQPMFIQQQQPLHNNSGSHQQFTMRECCVIITNFFLSFSFLHVNYGVDIEGK